MHAVELWAMKCRVNKRAGVLSRTVEDWARRARTAWRRVTVHRISDDQGEENPADPSIMIHRLLLRLVRPSSPVMSTSHARSGLSLVRFHLRSSVYKGTPLFTAPPDFCLSINHFNNKHLLLHPRLTTL